MTQPHLCPVCNRPLGEDLAAARFRPFCSRRCADVDLGRWLKGAYAIPAVELDDEAQTEPSGTGSQEGGEPEDRSSEPSPRVPVRH